jgi:hypothetical protein
MLSNILSRLSLYIDEIIGDRQCEVQRNRLTADQIFCIPQIPEKKWVWILLNIIPDYKSPVATEAYRFL